MKEHPLPPNCVYTVPIPLLKFQQNICGSMGYVTCGETADWLPMTSSLYELRAKNAVFMRQLLRLVCAANSIPKYVTGSLLQYRTSYFRSPLINSDDLNLKYKAALPISEEEIINHVGSLSWEEQPASKVVALSTNVGLFLSHPECTIIVQQWAYRTGWIGKWRKRR
jgi:hypothetical protein